MSKYYLAYGSNICVDRMRIRTPEAKIIGTGMLRGWQLIFREYATIRKCSVFETPVLVWEISDNDERRLDKYEGFPLMYKKRDFTLPVLGLNGEKLGDFTTMAYIMTPEAVKKRSEAPVPFCEYYNLIDYGYRLFGFNRGILEEALEESVQFWCYNK